MTLRLQVLLPFCFLLFSSAAVRADGVDDYVTLMTAVELDKACGGLKYMESVEARNAANRSLGSTPQFELFIDERTPVEEYESFIAAADQRVAAQVAAVGCTQQALNYIMAAKGVASEVLYRGLVLAFHFDAATEYLVGAPLDDYEKQAASGYDAYLQQVYRENFAAFAMAQRDLAMRELPQDEVNIFDPLGSTDALYGIADGPDFLAYAPAKSLASSAMNAVQFEVTAEANGMMVRPRSVDASWTIPELRTASGLTLPVIAGPGYQLVYMAAENDSPIAHALYSVTVMKPDGSLRVMFYGASAAMLDEPTVRLYVRSEPLPDGVGAWETFNLPTFYEEAAAFNAARVDDVPCLGLCYDFPLAATTAMLANPEGDNAEFFVSAAADATPPPITGSSSGRKALQNILPLRLITEP